MTRPQLTEGIALAKAGDKVSAIRLLMRVVQNEPDNELAWYWLAWCATKKDDRLHALTRVLEINPDNAKARAECHKLTHINGRRKRNSKQRYQKQPRVKAPNRITLGSLGASILCKAWDWIKNLTRSSMKGTNSLLRSPSRGYYSVTKSDVLSSGYRRSDYHYYRATDDDIEFWGLDEPGAPPPGVAGWVVWDLYDEMDADGDSSIDDPWDDPFM